MKNDNIASIFVMLCMTVLANNLHTQNTQPTVIPPSPTASSLGIFGDIPVSHYTGIPNISVPIYEINSGGIKVPISLAYHASGIRVAQEASWVGLGWALNAGGVITRTVRGWDDFGTGILPGYIQADPLPGSAYPVGFPASLPYSNLIITPEGTKHEEYSRNKVDCEPDLFYYNFGEYSGKMMSNCLNLIILLCSTLV